MEKKLTEKEALKRIGDYVGKSNVSIEPEIKSDYMASEDAFKAEYEKRVRELKTPKKEVDYFADPTVKVPEGEWTTSNSDEEVVVEANSGELISKEQYDFRCKVGVLSEEIKDLLFYKNMKYGSSALKPLNIFNKGTSAYGILVRIDDKLSRIKNEVKISPNDVIDLVGYLYLLLIDMGIDKKYFERLKD